jgi:hypothetical protein
VAELEGTDGARDLEAHAAAEAAAAGHGRSPLPLRTSATRDDRILSSA